MASNMTMPEALPPLPPYELVKVPDLIPGLDDFYLSLVSPVIAYWVMSIFFHIIDSYDVWPQYRLHTPAEIVSRNRVSRYHVLRDVIFQQIIQMVVGSILGLMDPPQMMGKEQYDVAVWATRVRLAQRALPAMLSILGINASSMAKSMSTSHPLLAGALSGGHYPFLATGLAGPDGSAVPTFATWELMVAKSIYWLVIPGLQFLFAVSILDTWQYFLHRAMHMNKWMYTTWHSRHHRLYVPYAYGALYNHPFEGFLLDTLGASLAYLASGMTARQGLVFFTMSSIKTVDDHCGYSLPWDPLQHISSNNAAYHDIHHQSWGIKTNFSQPFFTFWDSFLGTMWKGDTASKYERSRQNAESAIKAEKTPIRAL
ncbi:fatty acid hydroxylase [Xylariales sp. AK1849]|nr:fatty acid hydroxylase [Xylariales sp. AK1849]